MKSIYGLLFAIAFATAADYSPFGHPAYLTSSFGENRGTRYHAGIDYSTEMEEGWPVLAPEAGTIEEVRISPFAYGKVLFFRGESGRLWVFAHQSGFNATLDSLVIAKQYTDKKNDVKLVKPNLPRYAKGDTLTFAGSSGIGNPHLHLEIRTGKADIISPCQNGVECHDTLAPLILAAVAWSQNQMHLTSEAALQNGCLEAPESKKPLYLAIKIADYSRTPLENPMSVRRIELKSGKTTLMKQVQDKLSFNKMLKIREELLWAEEADTAGDWHIISHAIPRKQPLHLEVEDYRGNITTRDWTFEDSCANNTRVPSFGKFQDSTVYTFLSRPWLNLSLCESQQFTLQGKAEKRLANLCEAFPHEALPVAALFTKFPKAIAVVVRKGEIEKTIGIFNIPGKATKFVYQGTLHGKKVIQSVTGLKPVPWPRALAFQELANDKVTAWEFHPKGLHFTGNWRICIEDSLASAPLYWLGETSRKWFIFSNQTHEKTFRCAVMNELRDIGSIQDTVPPTLGKAYWSRGMIRGKWETTLRIPVFEKYSGIPDGNVITAFSAKEPWIAAEYDSEPYEIVFEKAKLPSKGEFFTIRLTDEAGNTGEYSVEVPPENTLPEGP